VGIGGNSIMPKNTTGGNKSKKQANKYANPAPIAHKVRTAEEEEMYGIVLKLYGGNLFECYCIDKKLRLGHIPGKMRSSRNKKDNFIQSGVWVLVGLTGTKTNKGQEEVQLLEVYNAVEVEKLKKSVIQDWTILLSQDTTGNKNLPSSSSSKKPMTVDDGIDFSNEADTFTPIPTITKSGTNSSASAPAIKFITSEQEEEINIDDI